MEKKDLECSDCGATISQKVQDYSTEYYNKKLCYICQKKPEHAPEQTDAEEKQEIMDNPELMDPEEELKQKLKPEIDEAKTAKKKEIKTKKKTEKKKSGITIGKYTLSSKEIVNIQGKNYICYAGLLRLAHENGLTNLQVEMIKGIEGGAMCHVRARFWIVSKDAHRERYFDGIGTGTSKNLSQKSFAANYQFEMAQTRAKARALRDGLNIGEVSAEEISDWKKVPEEYS